MGAGSDIALDAADIVLLRDTVDVVSTLELGKATMGKIRKSSMGFCLQSHGHSIGKGL